MLAKLITIVNDYSGYKLAGVVLTLLVLTSCNDYLEDYAEQSPTVAVEAAPFQWTRAQDIETRAMFVRNHGLGYSYNAVRGEYGKWEDIRCQVVDRYALEEYSKLTQSDFVKFQKSTYVSDKSSFKYSLRDYVASVNMQGGGLGTLPRLEARRPVLHRERRRGVVLLHVQQAHHPWPEPAGLR